MSYNKAYTPINWQNQPSTATALGATNLNKMDNALNTIDTRVLELDTAKFDADSANTLISDISFDSSNGVFTITRQNGTTSTINTALEKVVTNFSYNSGTQKIDLVLADGSTQNIDISAFVTNVDFENSANISWSVVNGKTVATIINGSVGAEKLQPNFLADCTTQANLSQGHAETSAEYADVAKRYAVGGVVSGDTTDNAKYYAEVAESYAEAVIQGIPTASPTTLGGVKVGSNLSIDENGVLSATDTTYGLASTTQSGLMSASDKTKLDGSAPKASPTFTGSPKAPTKSATDNSTNIATTAHVKAVLDDKIVMSTTDLEDGVSELATGTLYLVYEDAE